MILFVKSKGQFNSTMTSFPLASKKINFMSFVKLYILKLNLYVLYTLLINTKLEQMKDKLCKDKLTN